MQCALCPDEVSHEIPFFDQSNPWNKQRKYRPRGLAMRRFPSDDTPPSPPPHTFSYPETPGCIYDPFRDELFTATRGHGAFLNGLQMKVGDQETIEEATVACGAPPGVLALGPCVRGMAALAPHVRTTRMLGSAGERGRGMSGRKGGSSRLSLLELLLCPAIVASVIADFGAEDGRYMYVWCPIVSFSCLSPRVGCTFGGDFVDVHVVEAA